MPEKSNCKHETLLDAWRDHCAVLTIAQLSSQQALEDHLASFNASVVSRGLRGTALDGHTDVQGVITRWTFDKPALPNADALLALAVKTHEMISAQLAREACALASQKAMEGARGMEIAMDSLPSGDKDFQVLPSSTQAAITEQLKRQLRSVGFEASVHTTQVHPGKGKLTPSGIRTHQILRMSWAKAAQ